MDKLFNDELLVPNVRPTKLTDQQKKKMYRDLAKDIIKNKYSDDDDVKSIAKDLKKLYSNDNGFEKAKHLDDYGNVYYNFDGDFIDWLDGMNHKENEILKNNVRLWVRAHNPIPKFEKGSKLLINKYLNSKLTKDLIVYITGFKEDEAIYTLSDDKNKEGGYLITYELVESNCTLIVE